MGGRNSYLAKLDEARYQGYLLGESWGQQQMFDAVCLALNDRFGFGRQRLESLMEIVAADYLPDIHKGFEKRQDADVYRYQCDENLKYIFGEAACPWSDRYEGWEDQTLLRERNWK